MEPMKLERILGLAGLVLLMSACGSIPGQSSYEPVDPVEALEVPPDLDNPETDRALRVPDSTYSRVAGGPVSNTSATAPGADQAPPKDTSLVWEGGVRSLRLADSEEGAWRRVGFALERIGLEIEERERDAATYTVEYVDASARESRPNVFSRWFLRRKGPTDHSGTYLIRLRSEGPSTYVNILDEDGEPADEVITEELLTALHDRLS